MHKEEVYNNQLLIAHKTPIPVVIVQVAFFYRSLFQFLKSLYQLVFVFALFFIAAPSVEDGFHRAEFPLEPEGLIHQTVAFPLENPILRHHIQMKFSDIHKLEDLSTPGE